MPRARARNPEERVATAREMRRALEALAAPGPVVATRVAPPPDP